MLVANFKEKDEEIELEGLWQYDYGQKLQITGLGLSEIFEVHFFWQGLEKAKIVTGHTENEVSSVDIPNEALVQRRMITAYIYLSSAEEGETTNTVRMFVNKRPAPENFEVSENVDLFHYTLMAAAEYLRQAKIATNEANNSVIDAEAWAHGHLSHPERNEDNAKYYAELAQQEAESALTDVEQLHSDTVNSANKAAESRDSAAGYAQAAEIARNKVKESEENVNAQVTDFDTHVAEKTQESEQTIADARQQAVQTVAKQGELSVQAVKDETAEYIEEQKNAAKEEIDSRADEKIEEINQAYKPLDEKVELLNEDVDTLKSSTKELNDKKITKFYTSNQGETHITDSDNGKISDMRVYGRSEQKQYRGKNLLPTTMYTNSTVQNGIQFTNNRDGSVTVSGTATDITYFKLWGYNELSDKGILPGLKVGDTVFVSDCLLQESNSKELLKITTNSAVTINSSTTTMFVGIKINKNATINKTYYPQIEKGSEATSYEPYVGGQPSPSLDYPQEIKSVVNPTVKVSNEDGTKSQTVTLPYTLNAIPVSSGGNVTIDGQQYIADYVDVERGKIVRMCERKTLNTKNGDIDEEYRLALEIDSPAYNDGSRKCIFSTFEWVSWITYTAGTRLYIKNIRKPNNEFYTAQELKELSLDFEVVYQLAEKQETDLTTEQTQALKELVTYYSVTNISVNSEQLDGYTVFNYPISLAEGWNYVKQQIGDTREYIYDIDARTQDTDLQAAEAYVNSEYAVALTELEVM